MTSASTTVPAAGNEEPSPHLVRAFKVLLALAWIGMFCFLVWLFSSAFSTTTVVTSPEHSITTKVTITT